MRALLNREEKCLGRGYYIWSERFGYAFRRMHEQRRYHDDYDLKIILYFSIHADIIIILIGGIFVCGSERLIRNSYKWKSSSVARYGDILSSMLQPNILICSNTTFWIGERKEIRILPSFRYYSIYRISGE